jgi:hypothetical protein
MPGQGSRTESRQITLFADEYQVQTNHGLIRQDIPLYSVLG